MRLFGNALVLVLTAGWVYGLVRVFADGIKTRRGP